MRGDSRKFVAWGSAVAAGAALAASAIASAAGWPLSWTLCGWAPAAAAGVGGGAWLAHMVGRAGHGFFVAFGSAAAFRLLTLVVGLALALHGGRPAVGGFLSGFAAAFVALAVFEALWFVRASRTALNP